MSPPRTSVQVRSELVEWVALVALVVLMLDWFVVAVRSAIGVVDGTLFGSAPATEYARRSAHLDHPASQ
ncbi:MAG: hypothetical protein QM662_19435 [Gordonia sp. (in: high G+C Gram-positive bacteria)]